MLLKIAETAKITVDTIKAPEINPKIPAMNNKPTKISFCKSVMCVPLFLKLGLNQVIESHYTAAQKTDNTSNYY